MKYVVSEHALFQFAERDISPEEALHCIAHPLSTVRQPLGRTRYARKVKRRNKYYAIVIVTEKTFSQVTIITGFLSSKIDKYL